MSTTKYVVDWWLTKIIAYECTEETANFVWLKGLYDVRSSVSYRKHKGNDVFNTWTEAHAELTRRAEAGLVAARRQLKWAQGLADNVRSMKPPQEVAA